MKLALAASGLFLALLGAGLACGPTETFCYKEGRTCKEEGRIRENMMNQKDAGEDMEMTGTCFDDKGNQIPCGG
jgi:hypothetical protein